MKIIVLPSWYFIQKGSSIGTPFKEQTKALIEAGLEASILYVDMDLRGLVQKIKKVVPKQSFAIEEGIPTFRMTGIYPPKRHPLILEGWAKHYAKLYDAYREKYGKADIIHARSYIGRYAAMKLSQKYQIPYVISEHSSALAESAIKEWMLPYVKESYDHAGARIAISTGLRKRMQAFTNKPIEIIPNFINTEIFKPADNHPSNEEITFFTLGGFVPLKRFDLLIKAFKQLKDRSTKKITLRVGGWGVEEASLKELTQDLKLEDHVLFLGKLDREAVLQEMQAASIFVLPSQYETFGVVLIEALATGTPVIAANHDGALDIVTTQNGLLFKVNDLDSLTQAMKKITDQFHLFDSALIRTDLIDRFSNRVVVEQYKKIYNNTIQNL